MAECKACGKETEEGRSLCKACGGIQDKPIGLESAASGGTVRE